MKREGFTLVELLAVIVILAIVLVIAVPGISGIIQNATRGAFESDAKMVLTAINYKMLEDRSFDPSTVNETSIKTLLEIDDSNYKKVTVKAENGQAYIIIVGKNKWNNLIASGTYNNIQVQESLVLWLDAGNSSSYSGTGTTWYDISGNNNNATLVNGPTYSIDNGGNLYFNGTNNYATFYDPNLGNVITVEIWSKIATSYSDNMMFGWQSYDAWMESGDLGFNTSNGDLYGISSSNVNSLGIINNWAHYIFEIHTDVSYNNNKIYINGNLQTLSQQMGSESASRRNFNNGSGRIASWVADTNYLMPMNCVTFKIYNRALTIEEIKDNYNQFKYRFGIN